MKNIINAVRDLIFTAGNIATQRKNCKLLVELKKDKSPVTNVDKEIGELICNKLRALTPNVTIICEENPIIDLKDNTFWLIDPIDGTHHYINGLNFYTINIGLIKNGEPTLGFVFQPEKHKLYYTGSNGSLLIEENSNLINPAFARNKSHFVAAVSNNKIDIETKNFLEFHMINDIKYIQGGIKLCLVAEGVIDIAPRFDHKTMEWDTAAAHSLIIASGGNILDTAGKQLTYGKKNFINGKYCAYSYNWLAKK